MMREHDVYAELRKLKAEGELSSADRLLTDWYTSTGRWADRWHAFAVLGIFALNEGCYDKAEEYHQELVSMDPNDPYPHSLLSSVHRLCGDLAQAESEARLAVDLGSGDVSLPGYLVDLAHVLLLQDAVTEAERLLTCEWDAAVGETHTPDIADVKRLRLLGRAYACTDQREQAIDCYRRAVRLLTSLKTIDSRLDDLLEEMASVIRRDSA